MLVNEIFSRHWRDRKAVSRYAGLTGSPEESGSRRRERGLARAGNARVRSGMIQLAWRFVRFQKNSVVAQWVRLIARVLGVGVETADMQTTPTSMAGSRLGSG